MNLDQFPFLGNNHISLQGVMDISLIWMQKTKTRWANFHTNIDHGIKFHLRVFYTIYDNENRKLSINDVNEDTGVSTHQIQNT